jgi:hypothetical protein
MKHFKHKEIWNWNKIERIKFPPISVHEYDIYEHIYRKGTLLLKILNYVTFRRHLYITITLLE